MKKSRTYTLLLKQYNFIIERVELDAYCDSGAVAEARRIFESNNIDSERYANSFIKIEFASGGDQRLRFL